MEVVPTFLDVRHCPKFIFFLYTILTYMGDLGVMVTDLEEKKTVKVWLKFLEAKGDSGKLHIL